MGEEIELYLHEKYYDLNTAGRLDGVDALFRAVKEEGNHRIPRKRIQEWLNRQDTYTLHKPARGAYICFQNKGHNVPGKEGCIVERPSKSSQKQLWFCCS